MCSSRFAALLLILTCSSGGRVAGDDWPTFGHDAHRTAATDEVLAMPLVRVWVHEAEHPPTPAWPPPARFDYWHYKENLQPRVTFDHAYHVAAVGDRVYYGSSTDDAVVCLDAHTGAIHWRFSTEGPVRLAPTVVHNRLYVGADDGFVYCLDAVAGDLIWKQRLGPQASYCVGNERMISRWPVRSGVLFDQGTVVAAAGLFPTSEGAYLVSLDAESGACLARNPIAQSVQGYLLLTRDRVILSSGRTAPMVYRRSDGQAVGEIAGPGGAYTVLTDALVATGPGDTDGELSLVHPDTREHLFTLHGLHLIPQDDRLFVHGRDSLAALDRVRFLPLAQQHAVAKRRHDEVKKEQGANARDEQARLAALMARLREEMDTCWIWKTSCDHVESLILAGDVLFVGGDGVVAAHDAGTGNEVWRGEVDGRACGLAAASGRLLASTDRGTIQAFASAAVASTPPAPSPRLRQDPQPATVPTRPTGMAQDLLQTTGIDQGYCLLVGDDLDHVAVDMARASQLHVILVQRDAARVAMTREMLREQRLYGPRVVVHHATDADLPYPPYFANLVVIADVPDGREDAEIVSRLLRPEGGTAWVRNAGPELAVLPSEEFSIVARRPRQDTWSDDTWSIVRRGRLPGSGVWTHGFADPANTACSQDELVRGPLRVQWFGRPGPRSMADRHHRNVPPLYHSGRLYVPGENLVIAVDAYNGTNLWQRDIPQSLRLGAFLDCSNMVVDSRYVYLAAADKCHVLEPATGATVREIPVPQLTDRPHSWGYLACAEGLLFGSGRQPEASYYRQSREDDLALWFDDMALVTSDYLFALSGENDRVAWTYQSGCIINTTITLGGGRVYFLENHAPDALASSLGRVPMSVLVQGDTTLVALDSRTGEVVWKRPFDMANCRHIVYVNYAEEKLLVSGNRYVDRSLWYFFQAVDAASGHDAWSASHDSGFAPGGDHGEQNRHPTIVGQTVYTYPRAYHLHTGEQLAGWQFERMGHGCGNISASSACIFWRGGNPWQRELQPGSTASRINSVNRPGCFINLIPAGGLLLMPEASSGCTCGFPLQTSLAYVPAHLVP